MTTKLYLSDPYVLEFEADILERRASPDGPAVVLGETYFYPESGGQPYDLGSIQGIPIVKVEELPDETILHVLERFPDEDRARVHCRIDGARRRDHMQQHSGQHILSAAFVHELEADTTSFHLGAAVSTIDLNRGSLTESDVARAVRRANEVVQKGVPIRSRIVSSAEAETLSLRKPPPRTESLRLVEVEGFDNQACCGTHPRSSAEVGPVVIRSVDKVKGGTRVEFLCGDRALADHRATVARVRGLASILSSSEEELLATAEKLQEERKSLGKELARLKGEHLLCEVEGWMDEAVARDVGRVLVRSVEGLGPAELRSAANALTETPGRVVLLGSVHDGRAHVVFGCSEGVAANMGELLTPSLEAVQGRGGGSARMAQGGGPKTDGLVETLESAASKLS